MAEKPSGEKTEDATPRRRLEARKKGTVAKSTDLAGAMTLLAATLVLPSAIGKLGKVLLGTLNQVPLTISTDISFGQVVQYLAAFVVPSILAIAPVIFAIMAVGVATNFAQVGFVLSLETLKPTFEKLNPLSGFKRLFSARTLVEGLKAIAKLFLFGYISYRTIAGEWDSVVMLSSLPTHQAATIIGGLMHKILLRIALVWLAIGIVDYIFQRKQVEKQLKMTKDELKREMKQQEGSPEIKAALFQQRRKLLKGSLAKRIMEADVVLTNPTHFAVAIQYKRNEMHAPMVIAKGQDYLAQKIKEIARTVEIPIVENPPLTRVLYKHCEVGDFVPREQFKAVAEVLAYVLKSVKKAKKTRAA
ncbi:MAG: flagellar biosynthesis protein FlhB [Armatimonadetes bacterium]|nr:flagellar biosynthesis protein FlhB [Armatimonadota bacterium]